MKHEDTVRPVMSGGPLLFDACLLSDSELTQAVVARVHGRASFLPPSPRIGRLHLSLSEFRFDERAVNHAVSNTKRRY